MRKIAELITGHYKFVLFFWLVATIVMGVFAIRIPSILEGNGFEMDKEHALVMEMVNEKFDLPKETLILVFEESNDAKIQRILSDIEELKITSEIISPLDNKDMYKQDISYALLYFDGENLDMNEYLTQIQEIIDTKAGISITGMSAINKDVTEASQRDLIKAETIGLPIAIVVLLFAFGTVVAASLPLLIGIITIIITFGLIVIIGQNLTISIFILNIVPMLGLALSIDFNLLFISRYREERKKATITEAVNRSIITAGRAVVFSAFCVFIGLGAMMIVRIQIFENIALGGMLVVFIAVLTSLTFLPAFLILLGKNIDKGRILKIKEEANPKWRTFAQGVIKRPILISLLAIAMLLIGAIPVKDIKLNIPEIEIIPSSYESRYAYETMKKAFDKENESSLYLIAQRDESWTTEEGLDELLTIQQKLQEKEMVKEVTTIFTTAEVESVEDWQLLLMNPFASEQLKQVENTFIRDDLLFIPVTINSDGSTLEAQDFVRELEREDFMQSVLVGGPAKFNQEIYDEISNKLWYVLTIIIFSTFIILLIAFRSIIIPIKAIIMNVLGLTTTFGLLVVMFQYGLFGMEQGTIILIIPVLVFSLVFGLSMDYEVFLISRMQEEYEKTKDNNYSTVEGLTNTSKIITSAALVMVVLTGAFAFTDVMAVKQIGVGIAIAIFLDATIIRLLLVPSLMKLFGDWNWYLPFGLGMYQPTNKRKDAN